MNVVDDSSLAGLCPSGFRRSDLLILLPTTPWCDLCVLSNPLFLAHRHILALPPAALGPRPASATATPLHIETDIAFRALPTSIACLLLQSFSLLFFRSPGQCALTVHPWEQFPLYQSHRSLDALEQKRTPPPRHPLFGLDSISSTTYHRIDESALATPSQHSTTRSLWHTRGRASIQIISKPFLLFSWTIPPSCRGNHFHPLESLFESATRSIIRFAAHIHDVFTTRWHGASKTRDFHAEHRGPAGSAT